MTKIIVKDLMKGQYRESFVEARQDQRQEQEDSADKYSNAVILGLILVGLIGGAVIMLKVVSKGFNEAVELANGPAPKEEKFEAVVQPRPAPQERYYQSAPVNEPVKPVVSGRNWGEYGFTKPQREERRTQPQHENQDGRKIYRYEKDGVIHLADSPEKYSTEKWRGKKKLLSGTKSF